MSNMTPEEEVEWYLSMSNDSGCINKKSNKAFRNALDKAIKNTAECITCKKTKRKDELFIVRNRKFEELYMCKSCYLKMTKRSKFR